MERLPNEQKGKTVMTTWHSKESLANALWFFATCAVPDEGFKADCKDWIGLSIGNPEWAREIRSCLIEGRLSPKEK